MYNWTRVFVGYGDGASFAGNREDVVHANGTTLYFRGARILPLLVAHMVAKYGLGKARRVVLAGNSAGGLAVYANVDRVARLLPSVSVRGIAVSGWFMDVPNTQGVPVFGSEMQQLVELQNVTMASPECVAKYGSNSYKCLLPRYSFIWIRTPVFVQQSAYDSYQIAYIFTKNTTTQDAWRNCTTVPSLDQPNVNAQCTPEQTAILNRQWHPRFVADVVRVAPVAYLEPTLSHSGAIYPSGWRDLQVSGVRVFQAWHSWLEGQIRGRAHWIGCTFHPQEPYYPC